MLAVLATQSHGVLTCACDCVAKNACLPLPAEIKPPQTTQNCSDDGKSSAVISGSAPTQCVRANAADRRHPSLSQDPPDTPCTSDRVGSWPPPENLTIFLIVIRDRSHPLSSWEQRAPWGKIQQSTSNGGNGRRDGDVTATAMDGATAMRRRRDGDYDVTVTGRRRRTAVAGGSAGAKTKTTMTEAAVEATAIAGVSAAAAVLARRRRWR